MQKFRWIKLIHSVVKEFEFWPKQVTKNTIDEIWMKHLYLLRCELFMYFHLLLILQHSTIASHTIERNVLPCAERMLRCATYSKDLKSTYFLDKNMKILKIFTWPYLNQFMLHTRNYFVTWRNLHIDFI